MATRPRPKTRRGGKLKKAQAATLPVRITPELVERIDEVRPDMIPREPFVRYLVDIGLKHLEEEE